MDCIERTNFNAMKIISFFIPVVFAFCSCATIRPEPPLADSDKTLPPEPVISWVNMPVEVDLTPYFSMAEKNVATKFEGSENACEGIRYSYQFLRGPFRISGIRDNLNFSFDAKYKIKGSYCGKCLNDICLLPTPTFSCGYAESMRKMEVGYQSRIKLLNDYRLSSQTTLIKSEAIDNCSISFMNIDVTGKLMKVMREELEKAGKTVDSQFRAYELKPYLKEVWNKLSEPQSVEQYGYLQINPQAIAISELSMNGNKLNMKLGLSCRPVFSSSFVSSLVTPLPDLSSPVSQKGFTVHADLFVQYEDLNRLVNEKMAGYEFRIKNKKLIVNNIQISGLGNSKIALKLDFKGYRKGIVYLTGKPEFDAVNNTVTIPDLSFELKSRNILLKSAGWLLNEKITNKIRSVAVFDMNKMLQQYKGNVQQQLNKPLTDMVRMYGSVSTMSVKTLLTSPQSLFLRVYCTGELGVSIK